MEAKWICLFVAFALFQSQVEAGDSMKNEMKDISNEFIDMSTEYILSGLKMLKGENIDMKRWIMDSTCAMTAIMTSFPNMQKCEGRAIDEMIVQVEVGKELMHLCSNYAIDLATGTCGFNYFCWMDHLVGDNSACMPVANALYEIGTTFGQNIIGCSEDFPRELSCGVGSAMNLVGRRRRQV